MCSGVGVGSTGSVTRLLNGTASRVQTGLLSVCTSENGNQEVVGVDALAFKGSQLYGIATGKCPVAPIIPQAGRILRLDGGTSTQSIGNVSAYECANDPDGFGIDTDPYGIAISGSTYYVADAAGNDILKVEAGVTSLVAVLPGTVDNQPVPTSLAFGPDGALYVGTLAFGAGPGGAKVYRIDLATNAVSVYADGFTAITGIAFSPAGTLYVSEWTTGFGPTGPSTHGAIAVVPWGGGSSAWKLLGKGVLHFPGGVAVHNGALYVSNWSIAPGFDGPFGPGNHGMLMRFGS